MRRSPLCLVIGGSSGDGGQKSDFKPRAYCVQSLRQSRNAGTAASLIAHGHGKVCEIAAMSVIQTASSSVCRVLAQDRDLADAVPLASREQATRECIAREVSIPVGRWDSTQAELPREGIGLLVLNGLLIRRVGIDSRFGAELLGTGDLLRPWQGEDEQPTLLMTTGWYVIEPIRMAILDNLFAQRTAHYSQLTGRLVGRALERSRNLAVNMAIVHQARVDIRLHMLFWHLAGRWGRVRKGGVHLPLPLTHNVLADLAAARRPTVTTALSDLARHELVSPIEDGWLLLGEPPGELLKLAPVPSNLTGKLS
jgi:hypothetical protein